MTGTVVVVKRSTGQCRGLAARYGGYGEGMNTRIRQLTIFPAATLLAITLAACGGDDSGDSSGSDDQSTSSSSSENSEGSEGASESEEAAEGVEPGAQPGFADGVMTGTGYAYEAPSEWTDQTKVAQQTAPQIDSTVARNADNDGFADNVTVVVIDPSPVQEIEDIPATLEGSLDGGGFKDLGKTTVGGEDASHITAQPTIPGGTGTYELERYDVIKDGKLFGIEFSFSKDVSEDERRSVAEDVIASWTWTD